MSLTLPAKSRPGTGWRSVLLSLARLAQRDVEHLADHPERRIHSLRKGMKKYRSVLRLGEARLPSGTRRDLRQRVRALKDGMAGSRDEMVIFKTVRSVLGASGVKRLGLKAPHEEAVTEIPAELSKAAAELVTLTEALHVEDALSKADVKTAAKAARRRADKGMKKSQRTEEAHEFHLWRKHVKDVWYHSVALGHFGKKFADRAKTAEALSDTLGREHDLTIVLETVKGLTDEDQTALKDERERLRKEALALAKK